MPTVADPPYTIQPAPSNEQPAFAGLAPAPQGIIGIAGEPWENDQAFLDLIASKIYSCPSSPAGDYAFFRWLYDFCLGYKGGGAVAPAAPAITALTPDTGPAGADITVAITGSGFDVAPTVDVGGTTLTPEAGGTATDLSVVIPAASIAVAGSVQVAVQNSDSQWSNALTFTVT